MVGRDDETRRFEQKCPASTDAEELPFWLEQVVDGEFVSKRGIVEINIMSNGDINVPNTGYVKFRVEVRMLHGQYQHYKTQISNTLCIDVLRPKRVSPVVDHAFQVIMPRVDGLIATMPRSVILCIVTSAPVLRAMRRSARLGLARLQAKDPSITMSFNVADGPQLGL